MHGYCPRRYTSCRQVPKTKDIWHGTAQRLHRRYTTITLGILNFNTGFPIIPIRLVNNYLNKGEAQDYPGKTQNNPGLY